MGLLSAWLRLLFLIGRLPLLGWNFIKQIFCFIFNTPYFHKENPVQGETSRWCLTRWSRDWSQRLSLSSSSSLPSLSPSTSSTLDRRATRSTISPNPFSKSLWWSTGSLSSRISGRSQTDWNNLQSKCSRCFSSLASFSSDLSSWWTKQNYKWSIFISQLNLVVAVIITDISQLQQEAKDQALENQVKPFGKNLPKGDQVGVQMST